MPVYPGAPCPLFAHPPGPVAAGERGRADEGVGPRTGGPPHQD